MLSVVALPFRREMEHSGHSRNCTSHCDLRMRPEREVEPVAGARFLAKSKRIPSNPRSVVLFLTGKSHELSKSDELPPVDDQMARYHWESNDHFQSTAHS